MATRADVERYAQANRDVRTLALRDLAALWVSLDLSNPAAVRADLEESLPGLVVAYGEIAATIAADFFDDMREAAGALGRHSAFLAPSVDVDGLLASTRWAISPLFTAELSDVEAAAAQGRLEQVTDRFVLQPGRNTIAESVERDPAEARWARVPVGVTCGFCLVLASRGPAYTSAASAGRERQYHADCDCTPTPMWPDQDLPDGYDPDALYQQYQDARSAARSGSLKPVLAELRRQQRIH